MKEEYRECPSCHNMVDKTDKECPYCLYSFWFTNTTTRNNVFDNEENKNEWELPTSFWDLISKYQQWWKILDNKWMKKQVSTSIIIFIIIFRLLPTLIWIISSILPELFK